MTMSLPIASLIILSSIPDRYVVPINLARLGIFFLIVVASIVARYWRFFTQWLSGIRGRDWTSVSALIDITTVLKQTEQGRGGEGVVGYLATLTYFYRNPELQTGDYCRMFAEETDAQDWAASYKGKTVMVHIDPRDPSHSVLRKEEL